MFVLAKDLCEVTKEADAVATKVKRDRVTEPTHGYRWRVTLYDKEVVPRVGADGSTQTEGRARAAVQEELERLQANGCEEAYAAITLVSKANPMDRVHVARAELERKTGMILWYDMKPSAGSRTEDSIVKAGKTFEPRSHTEVSSHLKRLQRAFADRPEVTCLIKYQDHKDHCGCEIRVFVTNNPGIDTLILAAPADGVWSYWWPFIERIGSVEQAHRVAEHVTKVLLAKAQLPQKPL